MKKIIVAVIGLFTLATLNGQVEQQSLPGAEEISNRRTSFNMEEIKVRWKKAALENCTGVPCVTFTCGTSTVSDIDGNTYNTVLIGTQCWTKENLKVTKYNDGTPIPDETANTAGWGGLTTGARSDYTGAASYIATYGYLYNWYAAKGVSTSGSTTYKNICPTGWHVPTDGEWTALQTQLGGISVAGGKMKSTTLWQSPFTGADNSSGFSALPGGVRLPPASVDIGNQAFFWSATTDVISNFFVDYAWFRSLSWGNTFVNHASASKNMGKSVRCLKD